MADINAAVTQAVMTVDQANSTTANRQIYNGNCPTNFTVAQCRAQGLDPGQLPRPDNWNQTDMRPFFRARVQPCQAYYAIDILLSLKEEDSYHAYAAIA